MDASTNSESPSDHEHSEYSDGDHDSLLGETVGFDVKNHSAVAEFFESLLNQLTQRGLAKCLRQWWSAFDSLSGSQNQKAFDCWPSSVLRRKDIDKHLKRDLARMCVKLLLQHGDTPADRLKRNCAWTSTLQDATKGVMTSEVLCRGPETQQNKAFTYRINHSVLPRLFRFSQSYEDHVKQSHSEQSYDTPSGSSVSCGGFLAFQIDPSVMDGDFWAGDMPTLLTLFKQKLLTVGATGLRALITRWISEMRSLTKKTYKYHDRLPQELPPMGSPSWWPQLLPYSSPTRLKLEELAVVGVEILQQHRKSPVDQAKRRLRWTDTLGIATNSTTDTMASASLFAEDAVPTRSGPKEQITWIMPEVFRIAQLYEDCVKRHKLWTYNDPRLFPINAMITSTQSRMASRNAPVSTKRNRQPSEELQSPHSNGPQGQAHEPLKSNKRARDATYAFSRPTEEQFSMKSDVRGAQSNAEVLEDSHTVQRVHELELSLAATRKEHSLMKEQLQGLERQLSQHIGICDDTVTRDRISGHTTRSDPSLVPTLDPSNLGLAISGCSTGAISAVHGQSVASHQQRDRAQRTLSLTQPDPTYGIVNNMHKDNIQMNQRDDFVLRCGEDQLQYWTENPPPTLQPGHTSMYAPVHAQIFAPQSAFPEPLTWSRIDERDHRESGATPTPGELASREVGTSSSQGMTFGALDGTPRQSSGSQGVYHTVGSADSESRNRWDMPSC